MSSGAHLIPVQRFPTLTRGHLVDRALAGDPALILLRGGAGSGKSVVAAQIAEGFARARGQAVWVRLDEDDASFGRIWQRIIGTIVDVGLAPRDSTAHDLVEGGFATVNRSVLTRTFAELTMPLLVVVDASRASLADSVGDRFATSLIDTLEATADLSFVLTMRQPPNVLTSSATRLRVPVRDIDAASLMLGRTELEELVRLRLPNLDGESSTALATSIYEQSGGWPLAAHALVVEREVDSDTDATRHHGSFVRDYVDQLLEASSPDVAVTLCASAAFAEVSALTLASMLDIPEADAAARLDAIQDSSFGYRDDAAGTRWYHHHQLVRDELQSRSGTLIGDRRLREMYARAAVALQSVRQDFAIYAAFRAEEWALLSDLLLHRTEIAFRRNRPKRWLSEIPGSVRERYPVLAAFALLDDYAFPSGRFGQVIAGFKVLAGPALATASQHVGLTGAVAAGIRMVAARLSGNEKLAVTMAERVQEELGRLTEADLASYRMPMETASTQVAITYIHAGRFSDAEEMLEPVQMWHEHVAPKTLAHTTALAAWSNAWRGDMPRAHDLIERGNDLRLPFGWQDSYIGAGYRIAAAMGALEQGDSGRAEHHLAALAEHESTIEHWPFLAVIDSLIAESHYGAGEALDRFNAQLKRRRGKFPPLAWSKALLQSHGSRLRWHAGQEIPRSKRRHAELSAIFAALSRGENELGVALTGVLLDDSQGAGSPRARSELLLLRAESLRRSGDTDAASQSAHLAAGLMDEYGLSFPMRVIPRSAAEQLARLVPTLPLTHSLQSLARETAPLTPAQRRTLVAVVEAGSVSAAAQRLFISPDTVKAHLKAVYRKLGVTSRADAVKVAAEAGLLTPPTPGEPSER
ncbi:MAG: LuxR C-terminal-related transcriptional regulator [Leucobacter sp.]